MFVTKTNSVYFVIVRLQRARSQPNLLCLGDEEEEEGPITNGHVDNHIPLRSTLSNPHLLDLEATPHDETDSALDKVSFLSLILAQAICTEHSPHESAVLTYLYIRPLD
jgi:hypothetical protein